MRKSISIIVLAVYTIVMAHSFIPHHHHSDFTHDTPKCDNHNHAEHQEHLNHESQDCCVNNSHDDHSTNHCTFSEKTILKKSITLSDLFLPSSEIDFIAIEKNKQTLSDCYIPIKIPDPKCRDVLLRGPPHFS